MVNVMANGLLCLLNNRQIENNSILQLYKVRTKYLHEPNLLS